MLTDTNLNSGGKICSLKCFLSVFGGGKELSGVGTAGHPAARAARPGWGIAPRAAQPPPILTLALKPAAESRSAGCGPAAAPRAVPHVPAPGSGRGRGGHGMSPPLPTASPSCPSRNLFGEAVHPPQRARLFLSVAAFIVSVSVDKNRGLFSVKLLILKGIAGSVWALGENRLTHAGRYFVALGLKAKFLDRFVQKVL